MRKRSFRSHLRRGEADGVGVYPNNPFGAEDALTFIYRDIFRNLKHCKASEDGYAWICKRAKEDLWEHYRRFVGVRLDCIERDFAGGKRSY